MVVSLAVFRVDEEVFCTLPRCFVGVFAAEVDFRRVVIIRPVFGCYMLPCIFFAMVSWVSKGTYRFLCVL